MLSVHSLCERLHKDGKKVTPQRRLIYQALERNTNHPCAEDIYGEVRAIIPDISLATVYKTLRELVGMGEILEITFQGDQTRFDTTVIPHNHFVCVHCHSIENILEQINIPEPDALRERNFHIRQSEIIYWGLCSSCQS